MQHAVDVRVVNRAADLQEVRQDAPTGESLDVLVLSAREAEQDARERLPANPLHGEVEAAVLDAQVVDGDDRGVLELALDARLAQEALARLGRLDVGVHDLGRDAPADALVLAQADLAHAAGTEDRAVLVAPAALRLVELDPHVRQVRLDLVEILLALDPRELGRAARLERHARRLGSSVARRLA